MNKRDKFVMYRPKDEEEESLEAGHYLEFLKYKSEREDLEKAMESGVTNVQIE